MKQVLSGFQQQHRIDGYELVDISRQPEVAEKYGVREVPWLRMGEYEFSGSHTAGELEPWLPGSKTASLPAYFAHLLKSGNLLKVIDRVRREPECLPALITLMAEPESPIAVQLGIGAVMESLQGSEILVRQTELLAGLTTSKAPGIRADACHYLGLTASRNALSALQACLEDENSDVREIAAESIELINGGG